MKYKISVILPVYNGELSLIKTVNSIMNQTIGFENIELLIIDDCSEDATLDIMENLEKNYNNVQCIYLKNNSGSPGKPRNEGIKRASSDYIMFIDNGDLFLDDICEIFFNKITNENVDVVSCNHIIHFNGIVEKSNNLFNKNFNELIFNPNVHKNFFKDTYVWNKIFKKSIILKNNIKFLEKSFPEDAYFVIKYLFFSSKAIFLEEYYGYEYIIPEDKNDINSMSRSVDKNKICNYISGLYKITNLIKMKDDSNLILMLSNGYILVLISYFVKFKDNISIEKEIIDEIYNLEIFIGVDLTLNQKWAILINNAIMKKEYTRAIYYSRLIYFLQSSTFLKKLYRKKINKKTIY